MNSKQALIACWPYSGNHRNPSSSGWPLYHDLNFYTSCSKFSHLFVLTRPALGLYVVCTLLHLYSNLRMIRVNRNIVAVLNVLYYAVLMMTLGNLLFQCCDSDKAVFRTFERTLIKINNAKTRRIFNEKRQ